MKLYKTIKKIRAGESVKLAALGDSLTAGWMVKQGYLDFFSEMLDEKYPNNNINIINRGIPGNTASDGMHRLNYDIIDIDPDLVFIQFGLNDAYMGFTPDIFKENIRLIINEIKSSTSAEILLVTSVAFNSEKENSFINKFYQCLEKLSEEENIPIALVHEYWKKMVAQGVVYEDLVQYDNVHPTSKGYFLMAEAIMSEF